MQKRLLLAGAAVILLPQAVYAQSATATESEVTPVPTTAAASATPDTPAGLDIVVNARRREERLQDVPVAVTAVTGDNLIRKGVTGLTDLTRVAPSLNVTQSAGGGRAIPLFTIRGQRQGDTLASVDPSVGVYVGDILYKRLYGLDQITFDLGTVEVLKGPQGTLFGLNVTGGNVVFRPNLPTDKTEASLLVSAGNYDYRRVEGFVNLPIAEGVALRVAGQYQKRDGYIHVRYPGDSYTVGTPVGPRTFTQPANNQNAQDLDGGGIRATLKLDPTDRLSSIFSGSYNRSSTNGTGFKLNLLQPTNEAGTAPTTLFAPLGAQAAAFGIGYGANLPASLARSNAEGFYTTRQNAPGYARSHGWSIANTTTYELSDSISIKNIIGYRRYYSNFFEDIDGSDLPLLQYGNTQRGREFSEEFQVSGKTAELNWIVGAYYEREKVRAFSNTPQLGYPFLDGIVTGYRTDEIPTNTSRSIFAQGTQELGNIVDGLSLTLGGRYTKDTRNARFGTTNALGYTPGQISPVGIPSSGQICGFNTAQDPAVLNPQYEFNPSTCLVDLNTKFSRFTYTATVDYKLAPGKLVYFAHRKGYRAGGFNTRGTSSAQFDPFRPETVFDFEVGTKLDFRFDNGMFLRTNLAVYKQNYKDIQRLTPFVQASGAVSTNVLNAARASIKGVEFEGTFIPVPGIEFNGSAAYTDPKYKSFIINTGTGPVDVSNIATFGGVSKWQASGSGRFTLPTPESFAKTVLQIDYYYQSAFSGQDSPDSNPAGRTPKYGIWNGRIEANEIAGLPLNAAIFARNIFDKKYVNFNYALQYSFGFASSVAGPPRMYGLELTYKFGQ